MRRLVNMHPGRGGIVSLGLLPFVLLAFAYVLGSSFRLAENPEDSVVIAQVDGAGDNEFVGG